VSAEVIPAPSLPPRRRARLARYALWQLRDYAFDKGFATLVVLVLTTVLVRMLMDAAATSLPDGPHAARLAESMRAQQRQQLLVQILTSHFIFGVLFATNGIVSDDRKLGYYRFLFAKPVTAPGFYATKFLVHGAGFLGVGLLYLAGFTLAIGPTAVNGFLSVFALLFLAFGGIGFLLSVVWRFDWLGLMTVYAVSETLWTLFGETHGVRRLLVHALPPVHHFTVAVTSVATGTEIPWRGLAWGAGYGLVCFVLGLLVLRRRSLAMP
jgi:hypothetical protein